MDGRHQLNSDDSLGMSLEEELQLHFKLLELGDKLRSFNAKTQTASVRYGLCDKDAVNFTILKLAMKDELGYRGTSGLNLVELSHKFTKERLIEVGERAGLSEEDVTKLLPAMAAKLTASEVKFTLSAFKGGLFSRPQELNEALRDVDNKYTRQLGL
jgi:hypothetical protein